MGDPSRNLELAISMFEGVEKDYTAKYLQEFRDLKSDDVGMKYADVIWKEKHRANNVLNDADKDKERILEYLTAGRLLLSTSGLASIVIRCTTKPDRRWTGRLALIQEEYDRYLVIFTESDIITKRIKQEAWIYQLQEKVALTTEFYQTRRNNQEVVIVQFGTAEEAIMFKDCFVKLNYGGCVITELFGPTPVDQLYARGFSTERDEWYDWNLFQTSVLLELKNIDLEVDEAEEIESPRNPIQSCALEMNDNWIRIMNSLLNANVLKSISVQVSEDVTNNIVDLEKDVTTMFQILSFCSCYEDTHEPVETMIRNLNNIRWGIAQVKSMQRVNALYHQTKADLTQLVVKMWEIQSSFEKLPSEEEVEIGTLLESSSDVSQIVLQLIQIEERIAMGKNIPENVENSDVGELIADNPGILLNITKLLKFLCMKAANRTLTPSDFKQFDEVDAQLRFEKSFAFEHLNELFWRKSDLEFQKTRAAWHSAKDIFGKDKITVTEDENGEKHIVDKLIKERTLDMPETGILYQCDIKTHLLIEFMSFYAELMWICIDFDEELWSQLHDWATLLRKMAVPDTGKTTEIDNSKYSGVSDEQSDFEIISQQGSNISSDRSTKGSSYELRRHNSNTAFDSGILATFTYADLFDHKLLGNGTFGLVSLANHPILKEVAVKEFTCTEKEEILWELNTINKLQKNEHVVNLYGFLYAERDHVGQLPIGYVMEYLPTSLGQVIHSKEILGPNNAIVSYQYTLIEALHQMRSIASAFAAVHELNIIHRDIKPDNILKNSWMRVRICDFGSFSNPETTTGQSSGIGTPIYMSPEMLSLDVDAHYDNKTDVYSLAITFWELLHREIPHSGLQLRELRGKILGGERPEITSTACISPLKDLIERCWTHNASDRPSMKETKEELNEIYEEVDKDKTLRNIQIQ